MISAVPGRCRRTQLAPMEAFSNRQLLFVQPRCRCPNPHPGVGRSLLPRAEDCREEPRSVERGTLPGGDVYMSELPTFSRDGPVFLSPNNQDTDPRIHGRDIP